WLARGPKKPGRPKRAYERSVQAPTRKNGLSRAQFFRRRLRRALQSRSRSPAVPRTSREPQLRCGCFLGLPKGPSGRAGVAFAGSGRLAGTSFVAGLGRRRLRARAAVERRRERVRVPVLAAHVLNCGTDLVVVLDEQGERLVAALPEHGPLRRSAQAEDLRAELRHEKGAERRRALELLLGDHRLVLDGVPVGPEQCR